ncbi:MAG: hypothetical protein IPG04_40665 [Polyangiaceae bacterium]|nr:hypothetical protein [Polyangiaceae bacterium]
MTLQLGDRRVQLGEQRDGVGDRWASMADITGASSAMNDHEGAGSEARAQSTYAGQWSEAAREAGGAAAAQATNASA